MFLENYVIIQNKSRRVFVRFAGYNWFSLISFGIAATKLPHKNCEAIWFCVNINF